MEVGGRDVRNGRTKENEVVLQVSCNEGEAFTAGKAGGDGKSYTVAEEEGSSSSQRNSQLDSSPHDLRQKLNIELNEVENPSYCGVQASWYTTAGSDSPESVTAISTSNLKSAPRNLAESVTRRRSVVVSEFSKPKSRFVESPPPTDGRLIGGKTKVAGTLTRDNLPSRNLSHDRDEEDDEVDNTTISSLQQGSRTSKKRKLKVSVEWIAFVCIWGFSIASLAVHQLKETVIWGLELWKWSLLVSVIFSGRLVTECFINFTVFLIERNFLFKKKVLYFVYGMKKSVQIFIWLSLVLITWYMLFRHSQHRSEETTDILDCITKALYSSLIGAAIWLMKTFLVKLLASSFQCSRFFDRIQESIFHQYVLRTLSGPPVLERAVKIGIRGNHGMLRFNTERHEGMQEVIDMNKLKSLERGKVSAWTMKGLIDAIRSSGLSTISNTLDYVDHKKGYEHQDKEITSEWEARTAGYWIFRNVAQPGSKYIEEEDLLRFMKRDEVDNVLPLFEGSVETRKIKRKALKNWLVNVYLERKSLVHSLNDAKTAIEELNKLASAVVLIAIVIVWLLVMGFLTMHVLLFILSQLLLVVFMFGNTARTLFEAIIFVFVMHPFDVGDRCVIDGVQMVVEEMNILTTVFLKYDNEKIYYPNSVLATKPIGNFYRSPEMSDSIEFSVHISTSIEAIGALKLRIKAHLESKPQHWRPSHYVIVKEIENVNKMKMALYVTHTVNFQNYIDKNNRRSELLFELQKIFEDLHIRYYLLPQEVHLRYVGDAATTGLSV